jgi:glutathione synthase
MVTKLQKGGDMLASYILMQRILPPILPCTMVRHGKSSDEDAVSELGIYGTYVRIGDKVHMNECVGHVLRTKAAASNEGGVAAGFAVLDSPYFE